MKMKKYLLLPLAIVIFNGLQAQLKISPVCPGISIDILDGSVNNLYPESSLEDIKAKLPCFNDAVAEPGAGCAGVFLREKGINFYTYRDYIEINKDFKGNMSIPLMGADRSSLFKYFGGPQARDNAWEVYKVRHGILVVYFDDAGKINKMQISSKSAETFKLCE
jgi:hypothetical protein